MHPLLADPWIAAKVDAAVAPYVGRLPSGEVAWMRDQLAETLASQPRAQKLLRRARPPVVERSGEVRRGEPGLVRDGGASAPGVTDLPAEKRPKAAG